MENIASQCIAGRLVYQGTGVSPVSEAYLVKASLGVDDRSAIALNGVNVAEAGAAGVAEPRRVAGLASPCAVVDVAEPRRGVEVDLVSAPLGVVVDLVEALRRVDGGSAVAPSGVRCGAIKPARRERLFAAAIATTVRVQTSDAMSVPSALTRERRT